nr:uncharacterized protein LOC112992773 [Dromaius novaehollandiae]
MPGGALKAARIFEGRTHRSQLSSGPQSPALHRAEVSLPRCLTRAALAPPGVRDTNDSGRHLERPQGDKMAGFWRLFETIRFVLRKSIPAYGVVFETIQDDEPQIGDIMLFPMMYKSISSGRIFTHAAVYCGDGEVIHFQRTDFMRNKGCVSKEGYRAMRKERGKGQIYRKIDGVNLEAFKIRVREVMNAEAEYSLTTTNCIHFALYLLGLVKFYHELVEFP